MHIECLEHKLGKYMLPTHDKRHNYNILIICQLCFFFMVGQHLLTKFVLLVVEYLWKKVQCASFKTRSKRTKLFVAMEEKGYTGISYLKTWNVHMHFSSKILYGSQKIQSTYLLQQFTGFMDPHASSTECVNA